jgi:hypothetical protein
VCRKGRKPGGPPLHSGTQRLNFESVEENDDLRRRNKDLNVGTLIDRHGASGLDLAIDGTYKIIGS